MVTSPNLNSSPSFADMQLNSQVAFDLVQDKASKTPFDWRERRGLQVFQSALAKGVLLRPIGNTVYFMPPYVISDDELRWVVEAQLPRQWQGSGLLLLMPAVKLEETIISSQHLIPQLIRPTSF